MKVEVEQYSDRFGARVALRFAYNADAKDALKSALPFPQVKWEGDKKAWSVQQARGTIIKACEVLVGHGYDCSALYALVGDADVRSPSDVWVEVNGGQLELHWPYIPDEGLRDSVRLTVRAISGRRFNPDKKCWTIPIGQARTLHGLLEDIYKPLAQAIIDCPQIQQEIEDSIERVEMSGATELKEVDADDLRRRLKEALPDGLELYPFQEVGVAFAEASDGRCLIGDEMGIGKTIQAIAYAALHPTDRPLLIVAPSNVKYNWLKEVKRWMPDETVSVVNSGKQDIEDTNVVIINYDLVGKQSQALQSLWAKMMVIDEVHYLKNKKAQRTEATINLARSINKVIALSGTAISSRPSEFFNSLNTLRPQQFPSEWDYKQRYCDPWHNGFGWDFTGASNIKELNERTRDLCIRRLKSEVLTELPDKVRQFIPVELTKTEREEYDLTQEEHWQVIDSHAARGEPLPKGYMLNMLNELRHICGRIKVPFAVDWIKQYLEQTDKQLVVFTHHRDVLKGIVDGMGKNYTVSTISGDVNSNERQLRVEAFQAGEIDVLVCNTMAAKEGITLTAADTVLFLEREWVPTDEEQAEDRVYRIGQESQSVSAVYLSVVNSIDEHFDRVVEAKREVVRAVLDGGDVQERQSLVKELVKRLKQQNGWNYTEE